MPTTVEPDRLVAVTGAAQQRPKFLELDASNGLFDAWRKKFGMRGPSNVINGTRAPDWWVQKSEDLLSLRRRNR